jgi:hypothetical protein
MSDLVTWLDVFTIIGLLAVSGWLMRGIRFFIEYRRRKYLEPVGELDPKKIRSILRKMGD